MSRNLSVVVLLVLAIGTSATITELLSLAASDNSSICHGLQFIEPTQSFLGITPNDTWPLFEFSIRAADGPPSPGRTLTMSHEMKLFGNEAVNYTIRTSVVRYENISYNLAIGSCRAQGFTACVQISVMKGRQVLHNRKVGFTSHELNRTHHQSSDKNFKSRGYKICISCKDFKRIKLVVYNKLNKTAALIMCPTELIFNDNFVMNSSAAKDYVTEDIANTSNYVCIALHNRNLLTHHSLALTSGSKVDNTIEPGCDSNVGLFGHSTGTDYGWGLGQLLQCWNNQLFTDIPTEHVTDAIACKIAKTPNYTTTALFLLNKEQGEIRDHVIEHEMALNYLLAHQGGLCGVFKGPLCCSDIDDFKRNVSDMIDKVHEEMKKFFHEPDPFGGLGTLGFYGSLLGHVIQWIPIIILVVLACFVCSWMKR
ncbi:glycoprotein [University of Helsinki virus 1]|uniref:Glycoprotein n=1 Tax=University of Helsinki virus TaxID=1382279 RepID=S5WM07_9VIRU|nr:glycoprotein [University of Helsinki virus]AGS94415.1 glycoprotein [University of Helsinki virus 1]